MKLVRAAITALVLVLLLAPRPAQAHAALVESTPEAATKVSSAPGSVVLRFSEPINVSLSRVEVTDPSGRAFAQASATERRMTVQLRSNVPGVYVVRWKTVSPLDGHTLRGSFEFGVGVTPKARAEAEPPGPRGVDLPIGAARAVQYGGLLTAVGMLLVIALAARSPRLEWASRPKLWVPLALALAGGSIATIGEALIAAGGLSIADVAGYLTTGLPGIARLVLVGAEAVALVASIRDSTRVLDALAVAFPALAASGHAAAVRPVSWGIGVDTVHLLSAGLWAGTIVALATHRPVGGYRGPEGRELLHRFTPVAIPAFLVTVGTGSLRAAHELSAPSDLVSSAYGRVLSLKLVAVAIMVPLSVLAWRRVATSLRAESVLAAVALVAAAGLAIYPLPPGRAEGAEEAKDETAAAGPEGALPGADDLTLAEAAGETLVGLTIRPGRPGRNDLTVFLLPTSGVQGANDASVELSIGEEEFPTDVCGLQCRRVVVPLDGGEQARVRVGGPEGGVAQFDIPELPSADGTRLIRVATERMRDLETLRVDESLRPGDPVVRNAFTFRSPDRMRLRAIGRFESVSIGKVQYQRATRDAEWTVRRDNPPIDVPLLTWSGLEVRSAHVVGRERIEGTNSDIVSFFTGTTENPLWFRLWIGDDHLVRRMEMRAYAHFMDQRLYAFDAPITIEPPVASDETTRRTRRGGEAS